MDNRNRSEVFSLCARLILSQKHTIIPALLCCGSSITQYEDHCAAHARHRPIQAEWLDLGMIDEMITRVEANRSSSSAQFPREQSTSFTYGNEGLSWGWDGQDICISHLCRISRDLSMCTGQCNEFCMGSGEGYSVGSPSLPRGSIYHQSPVSPPELFSRISNSYICCLGPERPPSLQTSHLLRNDKLKKRCEKQLSVRLLEQWLS